MMTKLSKLFRLITLVITIQLMTINYASAELKNFCDRLPRASYANLEKHTVSNDWFEVYQLESDIYAIYEPFQWQEVISYLIIGEQYSLLFDSGNGIGDIKAIVEQLTDKPIKVLNSHSHFDHIGGNHQFDNILSIATDFSIKNSQGASHEVVKLEVSDEALCDGLPKGVNRKKHKILPYQITQKIKPGDVLDLGTRQLEVLLIPGHTDDSIALLDKKAGLLWTGDSFYEGPIWLYFPETDLAKYQASLARLVELSPKLTALFPAHNTTPVDPKILVNVQQAFAQVIQGKAKPTPTWEGVVTFNFEGFGFLMRENYTRPEK
jgi:glyoxylase-like metal-dependent hydrolase (beta-lactamase superfamily II)